MLMRRNRWDAVVIDRPVAKTSTGQLKTLTCDRHPRPRLDSKPQYQEASSRRPTPEAARPVGSARTVLFWRIKGVQMNVYVFLILVLVGDDLGDLSFGRFNLSSPPEKSRLHLYTGGRETSRCLWWESYLICTDVVGCFNDFFLPLSKDWFP
jgi:hypothetical protein